MGTSRYGSALRLRSYRSVDGVVLACAAVATYRLSFAYARYLRFDRPVLTVLASQATVVLVVGVMLVQLA